MAYSRTQSDTRFAQLLYTPDSGTNQINFVFGIYQNFDDKPRSTITEIRQRRKREFDEAVLSGV